MPIRVYKCKECGHDFEKLVLRKDDSKQVVCPECGDTDPERRIGKASLRFKGSGFHCNDYD